MSRSHERIPSHCLCKQRETETRRFANHVAAIECPARETSLYGDHGNRTERVALIVSTPTWFHFPHRFSFVFAGRL